MLLLAAPTVVAMQAIAGATITPQHHDPPRVLELLLVNPALVAPGLGYLPRPLDEVPVWFTELSPAQQAVLGPREGRLGGSVATDGERVWANPAPRDYAWGSSAAASATLQAENPLMNAHEVWQWETQGFLIVSGVMDADWINASNLALDTFRMEPSVVAKIGASELWQETDCSPLLLPQPDGNGGPMLEERMTGLEDLPKPHCDAFRRMIAHPAVVERLNWMMGPGWAESPASASVNRPGAGGQQMHGGPRYGGFEASNHPAAPLGHLNATQVSYPSWFLSSAFSRK